MGLLLARHSSVGIMNDDNVKESINPSIERLFSRILLTLKKTGEDLALSTNKLFTIFVNTALIINERKNEDYE